MPDNTYASLKPRINGEAARMFLERAQTISVFERFGYFDPQGKNKTDTRMWRRINSLPPAMAPLADGIPPPGQKLTITDISTTLQQYGDKIEITDRIVDLGEDGTLKEASGAAGEQAARTIELIRYNTCKAGANAFFAGGVADRASVNSAVTIDDLRRVYRSFRRNGAQPLRDIIKPSPYISTMPIKSSYFAVGHTDLLADLEDVKGWVPVEQYSDPKAMIPNEEGAVAGFRFVLSELLEPWQAAGTSGTSFLSGGEKVSIAAQCDVYPLIFIAKNSYAIVPLQGMKSSKNGEGIPVKMFVVNPGDSITNENPCGQMGFISWITWQGCAILNETWIARLEVPATAL